MARKFLVSIDLNKNELQNAVIQNLGTAPSTPLEGQIYYNTSDDTLYFYNGSSWVNFVQASTVLFNTFSNRPAANTVAAGTLFFATDTNLLYLSDASNWDQISSFGTVSAQTSYGDASVNGTSNDYSRADHTHGTPSLTSSAPQTLAAGGTNTVGTASTPARADHVHALPNFGNVTAQTSFGAASANGAGTEFARNDHTHGTPTHDNTAHNAINLSALAVPLADVSFANYKITSLGTPTASTDAATKAYVDSVAEGLHIHPSVVAATTVNLTATYANGTSGVGATLTNNDTQAAIVLDGVTLSVNDRVLIKNQTSALQNGIYTVTDIGSVSTDWVLTRATDMDTSAEVDGGDFTFVTSGSTWDNTGWVQTSTGVTIGTDSIVWQQFSGAGTFTASNGVQLVGSDFSGVVEAGKGVTVGASGFAIDTAVVVRKYATDFGDGAATSYTITHNLGTRDVIVSVYDNSSPYAEVICDVAHSTTNTVTLATSVAPTSNQYRVVVHA